MRQRQESTGLGSEYERLVRPGGGTQRERRAIALRASSLGYRLASWFVSLLVVFVASLGAFGVTDEFTTSGWALLAWFIVLVALLVAWRRSWRRYRAPLIRLVPRSEYERFAEWQSHQEPAQPPSPTHSWKLDLRVLKRVERQD
jgi:hypothetical protein